MIVSSKVPAHYKQVSIVTYLAARFTYLSADEWGERVQNGRISHNGVVCTASTLVTQGDVVAYNMPAAGEPPPRLEYTVLYEDAWLLGINKPDNLLVHAKGRFVRENLIYQLRTYHHPPLPDVNLINRLDKETSGVILVARNKETLRLMSRLFADNSVAKTYLAIVHGRPTPASGTIDLPIGKVNAPGKRDHLRTGDVLGGKTAVTHYKTIQTLGLHGRERREHGEESMVANDAIDTISLVQLTPKTGRTHQLRVHLAAIGCPIVGDKKYGIPDEAIRSHDGSLLLGRQALHCAATGFRHPHTGEPCLIAAPLPPDMHGLMRVYAG